MKTQVSTYLPVFPRFYGTIFEPDEEQFNEEMRIFNVKDYDDLKFNNKEYSAAVAQKCCEVLEKELSDLGMVKSIVMEEVVSPREYNFQNDSINVKIEVDWSNVQKFIHEYKEDFSDYLKERYTSYSGFFSYHSNDINEWMEEIDRPNPNDIPKIQHKLGSILEFICEMEEIDQDKLYEESLETMHVSSYCEHGLQEIEE